MNTSNMFHLMFCFQELKLVLIFRYREEKDSACVMTPLSGFGKVCEHIQYICYVNDMRICRSVYLVHSCPELGERNLHPCITHSEVTEHT